MITLEKFITEASAPGANKILDEIISHQSKVGKKRTTKSNVIQAAKRMDPRGFELLEIEDPLTFDTLKNCYRRAVKKHHPDLGGKTENMKIINRAYEYFHELLFSFLSSTEDSSVMLESDVEPRLTIDYLYIFSRTLVSAFLWEWSTERAFHWVKVLVEKGWKDSNCGLFTISDGAYILGRPFASLTGTCYVIAEQFLAAGMIEKSKEALFVADKVEFEFSEGPDDKSVQSWIQAEKKKKRKPKPLHPRRVENLFRLKVINRKRYEKWMKRLGDEIGKRASQKELLADFTARYGFTELPTDNMASNKILLTGLVPETDYIYSQTLEDLSEDQQSEYYIAFYRKPSLDLVRKYQFVRLANYLRSIIYYYDQVSIGQVIRECQLFLELRGPRVGTATQTRIGRHTEAIIEFCEYIGLLNENARRERLEVLQQLDGMVTPSIMMDLGGVTISSRMDDSGRRFAIMPNAAYCQIAQAQLEKLKLALETQSDALWYDLNCKVDHKGIDIIEEFENSDMAKSVANLPSSAKKDPKLYIKTLEPYCKKLLEIAESMTYIKWLQIDHWINQLSIAYKHLKSWQQAKEWLDLYFSLPERIRLDETDPLVKKMKNRLNECNKRLTKRVIWWASITF